MQDFSVYDCIIHLNHHLLPTRGVWQWIFLLYYYFLLLGSRSVIGESQSHQIQCAGPGCEVEIRRLATMLLHFSISLLCLLSVSWMYKELQVCVCLLD